MSSSLAAKLKAQKNLPVPDEGEEEDGNRLEQLKRKRDYRRRRQAYRAKNVHITRRTPKEVCVDEPDRNRGSESESERVSVCV